MRQSIVALGLAVLCLGACASPRAIGQGDVSPVVGASAAVHGAPTDRADEAYVRAIQDGVLTRLGASRGADKPVFLVQVGVARAVADVGVSSAAGALDPTAWRSPSATAPWWRPWAKGRATRAVTLAVIDARDGKTIAWSSVRVGEQAPEAVAKLLVDALKGAGRP